MLAVGDSLYMARNTDLYRSADGLTWQRKTTTKSVDNLLCSIGGNIYAIDNTSLKLYRLAAGDWELLRLATPSGTLPDNFPVDGAGIWSDRSANGVDRVYIAGGVDKGGNLLGSVWTASTSAWSTNPSAPRGALGHWAAIRDGKIDLYQCVVPTTWNASPRDPKGQIGAYEAALMNTKMAIPEQPLEILRTLHSFDPCLACSTHVLGDDGSELISVQVR